MIFKISILLFICTWVTNTLHASITDTIIFDKINDFVWIHTTYKNINGISFPSNGLIIKTATGLILIDTSWDDELTEKLLKAAKEKFKSEFQLAVITHAHDDRIGGIKTVKRNNIRAICWEKTAELAKKNGFDQPEPFHHSDTIIKIGNTELELFYPGWGHSEDNIVVWLPSEKILFGGCLVKSEDSETLGNTKEADLKQWKTTAEKLLTKYGDATVVIPGHGNRGNIRLLKHTIDLLKK